MIAYNHYIKFIPQLKNDKKMEGSFCDIVTVQENSGFDLNEKLLYELTFFNNQGRDLMHRCDREFSRTQEGQLWAFEVKDVVTFFWQSGTLTLEYMRHDNFTEDLLKYWAIHVVLPTFFIIEGIYDFIHAGAVEIDEKPVLFIAKSFGGKSTMTDYFMKQGHTMISDDKVATFQKHGHFYAVPSFAYHRPYRNIEDLGFCVQNFAQIPRTMNAFYALNSVEGDHEVKIETLKGIEKFKSLRNAKEMNLFFHEKKQAEFLAQLMQKVSVFKVDVPWNLDRLDEVYEAIVCHHKSLQGLKK